MKTNFSFLTLTALVFASTMPTISFASEKKAKDEPVHKRQRSGKKSERKHQQEPENKRQQLDIPTAPALPIGQQQQQQTPQDSQSSDHLLVYKANSSTDDAQFATILEKNPFLEKIDLFGSKLCNYKIASKTLKKLNLGWTSINDDQLTFIIEHCPLLEELCLASCKNLKTFNIVSNKLKTLDVGFTSINDEQLTYTIEHCPLLEKLDLMGTNLQHPIIRYRPQLKEFLVEKYPDIKFNFISFID